MEDHQPPHYPPPNYGTNDEEELFDYSKSLAIAITTTTKCKKFNYARTILSLLIGNDTLTEEEGRCFAANMDIDEDTYKAILRVENYNRLKQRLGDLKRILGTMLEQNESMAVRMFLLACYKVIEFGYLNPQEEDEEDEEVLNIKQTILRQLRVLIGDNLSDLNMNHFLLLTYSLLNCLEYKLLTTYSPVIWIKLVCIFEAIVKRQITPQCDCVHMLRLLLDDDVVYFDSTGSPFLDGMFTDMQALMTDQSMYFTGLELITTIDACDQNPFSDNFVTPFIISLNKIIRDILCQKFGIKVDFRILRSEANCLAPICRHVAMQYAKSEYMLIKDDDDFGSHLIETMFEISQLIVSNNEHLMTKGIVSVEWNSFIAPDECGIWGYVVKLPIFIQRLLHQTIVGFNNEDLQFDMFYDISSRRTMCLTRPVRSYLHIHSFASASARDPMREATHEDQLNEVRVQYLLYNTFHILIRQCAIDRAHVLGCAEERLTAELQRFSSYAITQRTDICPRSACSLHRLNTPLEVVIFKDVSSLSTTKTLYFTTIPFVRTITPELIASTTVIPPMFDVDITPYQPLQNVLSSLSLIFERDGISFTQEDVQKFIHDFTNIYPVYEDGWVVYIAEGEISDVMQTNIGTFRHYVYDVNTDHELRCERINNDINMRVEFIGTPYTLLVMRVEKWNDIQEQLKNRFIEIITRDESTQTLMRIFKDLSFFGGSNVSKIIYLILTLLVVVMVIVLIVRYFNNNASNEVSNTND